MLKRGGKHVGGGVELDFYRPITLRKILSRILANRFRIVVADLIGPEQNYAVKGRSIQNNFHLVRGIIEGIKDDTDAALISLDQFKAFDRVDHRFLAGFLETAGFEQEFRRWISTPYHKPQAVVQVNGKLSELFVI